MRSVVVDERVEASTLRRRALALRVGDRGADEVVELVRDTSMNRARVLYGLQRRWVEILIRRRVGERGAVSAGGGLHVAPRAQAAWRSSAAHENSAVRASAPRAARAKAPFDVVQLPSDRGQIEPGRECCAWSGSTSLQQQRLRRGEVAGAHGVPGCSESGRGIVGHHDPLERDYSLLRERQLHERFLGDNASIRSVCSRIRRHEHIETASARRWMPARRRRIAGARTLCTCDRRRLSNAVALLGMAHACRALAMIRGHRGDRSVLSAEPRNLRA